VLSPLGLRRDHAGLHQFSQERLTRAR
jgi:hypothetical protein